MMQTIWNVVYDYMSISVLPLKKCLIFYDAIYEELYDTNCKLCEIIWCKLREIIWCNHASSLKFVVLPLSYLSFLKYVSHYT